MEAGPAIATTGPPNGHTHIRSHTRRIIPRARSGAFIKASAFNYIYKHSLRARAVSLQHTLQETLPSGGVRRCACSLHWGGETKLCHMPTVKSGRTHTCSHTDTHKSRLLRVANSTVCNPAGDPNTDTEGIDMSHKHTHSQTQTDGIDIFCSSARSVWLFSITLTHTHCRAHLCEDAAWNQTSSIIHCCL